MTATGICRWLLAAACAGFGAWLLTGVYEPPPVADDGYAEDFPVARPPLGPVLGGLGLTRTPMRMRAMVGWFGVRGIGSLYYLMYAINQGLPEEMALQLIHFTLVVVSLSILLHGVSAKPLIIRYWRRGNDTTAEASLTQRV